MRNYNHAELYPNTKMLSSSQILSYIEDPREFYQEYVLEVRKKQSQAMLNGTIFSELFAGVTEKERIELLSLLRPKRLVHTFTEAVQALPQIPSKYCELPLKPKVGEWKIRVTPDALLADQFEIIENKTGKVPWTQNRVNFSEQITIQAWAFWKVHGVPPKRITLNWINTDVHSQKLIQTFKTSRGMRPIKRMDDLISLVIENIEAENFTRHILYG